MFGTAIELQKALMFKPRHKVMIQSLKNNARTITLWVGILLALLLLLGTFGLADGAIADLGFDQSLVQKEELLSAFNFEHLKDWSGHMLKVIFAY